MRRGRNLPCVNLVRNERNGKSGEMWGNYVIRRVISLVGLSKDNNVWIYLPKLERRQTLATKNILGWALSHITY